MLCKRLKLNNLTFYQSIGYSKLAIFDHMGENDQIFAKDIPTNNGPKFKSNSALKSSILTLQNEI